MAFSEKDKEFMRIALKEAKKALELCNYPIGSVLAIDGELVSTNRNNTINNKDWISHAELNLLKDNSKAICERANNGSRVEIYTTIEPCIMCFGAIILNRISRVVYSCPDLYAGSTRLDPKHLRPWYEDKLPKIEGGLFKEEARNMMIVFLKKKRIKAWKSTLEFFEKVEQEHNRLTQIPESV